MSDLLIRNLDESVKLALQLRAERNARSLSAEVRHILGSVAEESAPRNALAMIDAIFPPALRLTPEEAASFDGTDHASDAADFS